MTPKQIGEEPMAYVTLTTWAFSADIDEAAVNAMAERNLSKLKELGVVGVYGPGTSTDVIVNEITDAVWAK